MGGLGCTRTTELWRRWPLPEVDGGVLPSGRDEGEGDMEGALPFAGEGGADFVTVGVCARAAFFAASFSAIWRFNLSISVSRTGGLGSGSPSRWRLLRSAISSFSFCCCSKRALAAARAAWFLAASAALFCMGAGARGAAILGPPE